MFGRRDRGASVVAAAAAAASHREVLSAGLATLLAASLVVPGSALARQSKVGEFTASGFLFKDSVEVTALDDPSVQGVTLYISDFKRSIVDKLQKDFFSEPSQASLTCVATGEVVVKNPQDLESSDGKEVFSEQKGINLFQNKTLRVRRVYDKERKTLVYIAYSTRFQNAADDQSVSTGRYRTSLCAVPLVPQAPALTFTDQAQVPALAGY